MYTSPKLPFFNDDQSGLIAPWLHTPRWIGVALAACCLLAAERSSGQDLLQSLRDDVRSASGDFAFGDDEDDDDSKRRRGEHCDGRSN